MEIGGSAHEISLSGTFPEVITAILSLRSLYLQTNFQGTIPESIGRLTNLETLELILHGVHGTIPPRIGQLKSLESLMLHLAPSFRTPLPDEIGDLRNLKEISLVGGFHGTIPRSIGFLTKLQQFRAVSTSLQGPLPDEIGKLLNLESLVIQLCEPDSVGLGQLPAAIGNLVSLKNILLALCKVTGTIPSEIIKLKDLFTLNSPLNQLEGTVPPLPKSIKTITLYNNRLTGWNREDTLYNQPTVDLSNNNFTEIPEALRKSAYRLRLTNNQISGTLPNDFWTFPLYQISLNNNNLSGTLPSPQVNAQTTLGTDWTFAVTDIDLSNNHLSGSIPPEFALLPNIQLINLDNNNFTGNLNGWNVTQDSALLEPLSFSASGNQLSGQLVDLSRLHRTVSISLSRNHLNGTIPRLSSVLVSLDLSHNDLQSIEDFQCPNCSKLTILDLSYNSLTGNIAVSLLDGQIPITTLSLKQNKLSGLIPWHKSPTLTYLDLSFNQLTGELMKLSHPSLLSLDLRSNLLSGGLDVNLPPSLNFLDISDNSFSFHLSRLSSLSKLISLDVSNNFLEGAPSSLSGLESLKIASISGNQLGGAIDLEALGSLFKSSLRQLYMTNLKKLPRVVQFSTEYGPWRTEQNQPSFAYPKFVDCYTLSFDPSSPNVVFNYDENQFNWLQCDCQHGFYGIPPSTCYACPDALANCSARTISIPKDHQLFFTLGSSRDDGIHLGWQPNDDSLPAVPHQSLFYREDCLVSLAAVESNCVGLTLEFKQSASPADVLQLFESRKASQCLPGSSGRLCSKCECDLSTPSNHNPTTTSSFQSHNVALLDPVESSTRSCFYKRGFRCSKCSFILTPSQSIPLVIGTTFALLIVLSIMMVFVLRGRRAFRDKNWEDLSLSRRIWNRLVDISKSGLISILISFLQMVVALTQWDAYLIRSLSQLMNGNVESVGLACFFPGILSRPFASLAVQLTLPLMVACLFALSVVLAELFCRWLDRRERVDQVHFESGDISEDETLLLYKVGGMPKKTVEYPAMALISSNTLSIFQFFYFGTSLAATEFFFSSTQAQTGVKYVQALPWMLYSDAKLLRGLSIPWLIFIVIGYPLAFLVFAWLIRHKVSSPRLTSYVGSLFVRYRHRLFWWEIVSVLKKLTVALLLRGLPASNPLQGFLITLTICIPLVVQSTLHPWKNFSENVMDVIGSVLLISSLGASYSFTAVSQSVVWILVLALDALFVVCLVAMIIHQLITQKTEYQRLWDASHGFSDEAVESNFSSSSRAPSEKITRLHQLPTMGLDLDRDE